MSEANIPIPPAPRRSPLRRAGCIIALVIWFAILLLPCFFIVLAVQQEIVIPTGGAPGQQSRVWLISEADARGIGISTASALQPDETSLCVQTDVLFLLWAGSQEPSSYCECYARETSGDAWAFTEAVAGVCAG